MRKLYFVLILVLLMAMCSPAFALTSKIQANASDEVWTEVKINDGYVNLVSRGHVLVVSKSGNEVAANNGWLATHSTSSTDQSVLGVAQKNISSGSSALVLQRGRGEILIGKGTVTSGDQLAVTEGATLTSRRGTVVTANNGSGEKVVATALETNTSDGTRTEAYIHVI